ncbi:MAG: hypothetical protein II369_06090 [Clostridia bacterium]|nr:hypothetical protein [Clostridia bacterium]
MKRGRGQPTKRGRGNLLDLFLILLLLFSVIGVGLRQHALQREQEELPKEAYCVTLLLKKVPSEWVECVSVGEVLYLSDGTPFGVLRELSCSPARESISTIGGTQSVLWEDGSYLEVSAKVIVQGRIREGVLLREGKYALLLWSRQTLYSTRAEWNVTVAEIVSSSAMTDSDGSP